MYRGLRPYPLYLFFACVNKNFFLAKVIGITICNERGFFYFESLYKEMESEIARPVAEITMLEDEI
jgi:hypothetical protein